MRQLTKAQTEAIVEEIQDRLNELSTETVLPQRATKEWEEIQQEITKNKELEKEVEALDIRLDELKAAQDEFEENLKKRISNFEDKYTLKVDWKWLDEEEGEKPSLRIPTRNFSDKIRRQIAILSIDKKGPLTAEDLMDTIFKKLSKE